MSVSFSIPSLDLLLSGTNLFPVHDYQHSLDTLLTVSEDGLVTTEDLPSTIAETAPDCIRVDECRLWVKGAGRFSATTQPNVYNYRIDLGAGGEVTISPLSAPSLFTPEMLDDARIDRRVLIETMRASVSNQVRDILDSGRESDLFFDRSVDMVARIVLGLHASEHATPSFFCDIRCHLNLKIPFIKQHPALLCWAVDVFSKRLFDADRYTRTPFFDGHQALFPSPGKLLDIDDPILTNGFDRTSFAAIPVRASGHLGDVLSAALQGKKPKERITALDIGTGFGIMPLLLRHILAPRGSNRPILSVGTELSYGWSQVPDAVKDGLAKAGVALPGQSAASRDDGARIVIDSGIPAVSDGGYDVITWIKPFVGHRDYQGSNKRLLSQIPEFLNPGGIFLMSTTPIEMLLCLHMLGPLYKDLLRRDGSASLSAVRLAQPLRLFDSSLPMEQNLREMRVLNPREEGLARFVFVLKRHRDGEAQERPINFYSSFLGAYNQLLRDRLEGADEGRRLLIEQSLAITNPAAPR